MSDKSSLIDALDQAKVKSMSNYELRRFREELAKKLPEVIQEAANTARNTGNNQNQIQKSEGK